MYDSNNQIESDSTSPERSRNDATEFTLITVTPDVIQLQEDGKYVSHSESVGVSDTSDLKAVMKSSLDSDA